ncbi:MAG: hypothetical protein ACP5D2_02470 [Candidatus Nanoarchaeia archaeon]
MVTKKIVPKDKKLILNIAGYLKDMYKDYNPYQQFSFRIIPDKNNKTIKLRFTRNGNKKNSK